jgi:hypothetical protein
METAKGILGTDIYIFITLSSAVGLLVPEGVSVFALM